MKRRSGFLDWGGCGFCFLGIVLSPLYLLVKPIFDAFQVKPEEIDINKEKANLKQHSGEQTCGIGLLIVLICILHRIVNPTSEFTALYVIVAFLGAILILGVAGAGLKYLILKYKEKRSGNKKTSAQ